VAAAGWRRFSILPAAAGKEPLRRPAAGAILAQAALAAQRPPGGWSGKPGSGVICRQDFAGFRRLCIMPIHAHSPGAAGRARIARNVAGLLAALLLLAPLTGQAEQRGREDDFFVIANTQFTVLHELGHAVLTSLDIPLLVSEEDAADQLATLSLLRLPQSRGGGRSREKLLAAANAWLIEWQLENNGGSGFEYWDSHPLDIQRYYNINCLSYGSDPAAFHALRGAAPVPYPRAWRCPDEFARASQGLEWIAAHHGREARPARAGRRAPARAGRITVVYEPPTTPERAEIVVLMKRTRVLEDAAAMIQQRFELPHDINIVLANICGATAYWRPDLREVIVCYRLIEHFRDLARYLPCLQGWRQIAPARDAGERVCRDARSADELACCGALQDSPQPRRRQP
jgi:hypothetical protein